MRASPTLLRIFKSDVESSNPGQRLHGPIWMLDQTNILLENPKLDPSILRRALAFGMVSRSPTPVFQDDLKRDIAVFSASPLSKKISSPEMTPCRKGVCRGGACLWERGFQGQALTPAAPSASPSASSRRLWHKIARKLWSPVRPDVILFDAAMLRRSIPISDQVAKMRRT